MDFIGSGVTADVNRSLAICPVHPDLPDRLAAIVLKVHAGIGLKWEGFQNPITCADGQFDVTFQPSAEAANTDLRPIFQRLGNRKKAAHALAGMTAAEKQITKVQNGIRQLRCRLRERGQKLVNFSLRQ
jgi:hypothetical protein